MQHIHTGAGIKKDQSLLGSDPFSVLLQQQAEHQCEQNQQRVTAALHGAADEVHQQEAIDGLGQGSIGESHHDQAPGPAGRFSASINLSCHSEERSDVGIRNLLAANLC